MITIRHHSKCGKWIEIEKHHGICPICDEIVRPTVIPGGHKTASNTRIVTETQAKEMGVL